MTVYAVIYRVALVNSYLIFTFAYIYRCIITALSFFHLFMATIADIEGIGTAHAKKMRDANIQTVEDLLKAGATPSLRKKLAELLDVSEKVLLEWINHADLFRIDGVGSETADMLEEAGVDTVKELAQRSAENLLEKIVEVNEKKKLMRKLPSVETISGWIEQAKKLKAMISY